MKMKTLTLNAVTRCLCTAALFASLGAIVQGQTLVDKTPVLHMSFDNVSGTTVINDGSGGSAMNGVLNGAGATIVGGGKFGNALQVTGVASSDASVRIANAVVPFNVQGGGAWTLALWIQTSTKGATWAYQGDGGWNAGNTTFFTAINNGGTGNASDAAGGVRNSSGWEQGTTTVDDGLWHHIVFTYDGTTKREYVDGVLDTWVVDQWNASAAVGGQFWIGGGGTGEGDGQVCLNGLIDEVYVFNQALSSNDVHQLFSNNTVPIVPVAVTVSPTQGYRGQVVLLTATATPASGSVTNAKANLSAVGLSANTTLVLSSGNTYTNSFTIPNSAAIGAANVKATVIDTEPLIGSGGTTFTVLARPPTNASVVIQLTNETVYAYDEASFYFGTTNDAPQDAPWPMNYAWYKNGQLVTTNVMGPYFTFLTTPADDGAQIYAIASVAATNYSSISITSAVVTLSVNASTPVYTNGLKQEVFSGVTARANLEIGNTRHGVVSLVTNADSAGGFGDNTSRRYSGFFIPPTSDNYVFFVASDDDSDVFVSTDTSMANKRLIAQESGYSGQDSWQAIGGNGSLVTQKRSDQWTNGVGATPYASGIPLVAGQKYYFEIDMHNGGGGDNCSMTYETETELTADPSQPIDGSASRMTVTNNNIAVITWPGTNVAFVAQPKNTTVYEGGSTNFSALAASDAGMAPYYQWFLVTGGNFPGTPLTGLVANGTNVNLLTIPRNYTGDQIYCVATTEEGGISTTSSVVNLTVLAAVNETGFLKLERWNTITSIATLESGVGVGTPDYTQAIPAFAGSIDNPSGQNNFVRRISGYFIPATSGSYKFYTTGDDDSDLFISTDNTPGNKRLVAHEAGWNTGAQWAWDAVGGGGGIASQMHSDTFTNSLGTPYASGIALVAGQKYYIEQDWHQGGGGANNAATWAMIGDTDPAVGTPTKFTGNVIAMSAVQSLNVTFTQQPTNATSQPQGYATFSAGGSTDSQTPIGSIFGFENAQGSNYLFFQWYKNGVAISGANAKSITLGPLQASDSGASIYCQARSLGYADSSLNPIWTNSTAATITISPQAVFEPGLLKEDWWTNGVTARAVVENGSVGNPNFTYTTPLFEGPSGTGNGNGPTIDYVQRIDGYFVPKTTGSYVFWTDSDDDSDLFISTDASPANKRLVAQEAGWSAVRSWTAAGGGGSVTSQKRSDQWTPDGGVTIPYQSGIALTAGVPYYIEQVHHNGAAGGTHATATFNLTTEAAPVIGDQTRFTTNLIGMYVPRIQWVAFLQQPANATVVSGANPVTFTVVATNDPSPLIIGSSDNPLTFLTNGGSALQYQWYKNSVLIPGATSASYTQPVVLPSDQGAQFVCEMRALGYSDNSLNRIYSNSVPAVLTVVTDTVPPTLTYASTFVNTNQNPTQAEFVVDVTFSEAMNASSLSNASYTIAGVTVTNVSVFTNDMTVQLLVSSAPTLPLVVTVNGTVTDLSGNSLGGSNSTNINAETLTFSDIGTIATDPSSFGVSPTDPAYPSYVWVDGHGGYVISAEGSDIWNAVDGCNFGWELKTNNFDVVVRGVGETPTSAFAKEGLMIRETLAAGSREWSIENEPLAAVGGANRIDTGMRSTNGAASVNWQLGALPPPSYPNGWLRLQRTNSVLNGYYSTNGVNWVLATSYDTSTNPVPLTNVVYVGISTTSHANDYYTVYPPPPPTHYNTAQYAGYNSSYVAVTAAAHLSVSVSGSNVIISWTPAGGHLESSPALAGPAVNWQTVGTSNPATVPIGSGAAFFRVVNP